MPYEQDYKTNFFCLDWRFQEADRWASGQARRIVGCLTRWDQKIRETYIKRKFQKKEKRVCEIFIRRKKNYQNQELVAS